MSSTSPPGKARAIELVQSGALPVTIGTPRPTAMILEQDGRFVIRAVEIDHEALVASASASGRLRTPSWMPEHHLSQGRPTGAVLAEASTRAELVAVIRAMDWPEGW